MSNNTVLVFGSNGWIGGKVCNLLMDMNVTIHKAISRADDIDSVKKEITSIPNLTHVMSFIGRTHGVYEGVKIPTIDYLEKPGKLIENIKDNLFSPLVLSEVCKNKGIHFTYLGTGCIFDYDEEHIYADNTTGFYENDKPNFFGSSYSIVKGYTDRLMHIINTNTTLNVRIRMPITDEFNERNFITKITNYKKVCSIPNSMTVLNELLPVMIKMAFEYKTGTVNLTNPGLISHNEILSMYKEIVDPEFVWENFSIEEQNNILASKRSNNCLDTTKLESYTNNTVLNIKESVRKILYEMVKKKYTKNINLLVTGGCGFIGSNFINLIHDKQPNVNIINLDAMYYCASETNIAENIRDSPRYTFIKGNLCSFDLVKNILNSHEIDIVIHFAAQSHVQNSFEDSLQYTTDNVMGTHTLLECCRLYGKIQKFIHISTDEVYGESMLSESEEQKSEESILCPTNPYAATKAAAELIAKSYYHSFNLPIIITRGNNVYGPNQYPEKLIPLFIKLLKENKPVTIQGDGSNVRAFLHVSDVCSALSIILEKGKIGEIYNIGSDEHDEYTISEIAIMLIKKIKGTDVNVLSWVTTIQDRPFNDKRYYISNKKVKDLGWKIQMNFHDGIDDLIRL